MEAKKEKKEEEEGEEEESHRGQRMKKIWSDTPSSKGSMDCPVLLPERQPFSTKSRAQNGSQRMDGQLFFRKSRAQDGSQLMEAKKEKKEEEEGEEEEESHRGQRMKKIWSDTPSSKGSMDCP